MPLDVESKKDRRDYFLRNLRHLRIERLSSLMLKKKNESQGSDQKIQEQPPADGDRAGQEHQEQPKADVKAIEKRLEDKRRQYGDFETK